MYQVNFKYRHNDLVGVVFDDMKYIGLVESFRFTEGNKPLYSVSGVGGYVPETMIVELTYEQKLQYTQAFKKYQELQGQVQEFHMIGNKILG